MAHTFLLTDGWDLQTDSRGDIALVSDEYAIAQNVANAVRLFTREAYYDQGRGIPHFDIELGHRPPLSLLRARILQAAKDVEGVVNAELVFESFNDRILKGTLLIYTKEGQMYVEF